MRSLTADVPRGCVAIRHSVRHQRRFALSTETKRILLLGFISSLAASLVFALFPVSQPDSGTLAKLLLYPIPVISLFMFGVLMVPALWSVKRWVGDAHEARFRDTEQRLRSLINERDAVALEMAQLLTSFSPQLALVLRIVLAIAEGKPHAWVTRELVVSRLLGAMGNAATEVEILDVMAGLFARDVISADVTGVRLSADWKVKLEMIERAPSERGGHGQSNA